MGECGGAIAVGRRGLLGQVMDGVDGRLQSEDAEPEDESERKETTQGSRALTAHDQTFAGSIQFT